jgi:hypothetical protein
VGTEHSMSSLKGREVPAKRGENMRALMTLTALVATTLFIGSAVAQQKLTGTGQFCIKGASGPIKCEYQTMAQCEQARPQGSSDQCVSRSEAAGTIGGPTPSAQPEQPSAPGEQKD